MVDDQVTDFSKAVDIRFTRAIVAPLNSIIEKAVDTITVIGVIFGSIDTALGRNGMGTAGAVLNAEGLDVIA